MYLSSITEYVPSADVNALNTFVDNVGERFYAPETRHGIVHVITGVISIAIRMISENGELEKFCLSLRSTMPNMRMYSNLIFELITTSTVPMPVKWNCIRHVATEIGENAESSSYWHTLGSVIEKYACDNTQEGLILFVPYQISDYETGIKGEFAKIYFTLSIPFT